MKHVLILSTSLRTGSNSDILAKEAEKGAIEAGDQVEYISLVDKTIGFCRGCLACQKTQKCVIHDDAVMLAEKVKNADVLIFATPIYYYEMSGQMKTLLDRCNPLFTTDYKFREVYMIAAAADSGAETFEKAYHGLQGWVDCFEKAELKGLVQGEGINDPKEASLHKEAMIAAYELGKSIR